MTVLIFLISIIRLSTFYSGNVKKMNVYANSLCMLTNYAVFKDSAVVIKGEDYIIDSRVYGNDTIKLLKRKVGTSETYVDVYEGFKKAYSETGWEYARYFEEGKNFKLFATQFYTVIKNNTGKFFKIGLTNAHVVSDSLIVGYKEFSDTLMIIMPHIQPSCVTYDTVLVRGDIDLPRDMSFFQDSGYILTRQNRIYRLVCVDSCVLERLFPDVDSVFYYMDVISHEDTTIFYISTSTSTMVFRKGLNSVLHFEYDIQNIRAEQTVFFKDTVFLKDIYGHVFKCMGNICGRAYKEVSPVKPLYIKGSKLYAVAHGKPSYVDFSNPVSPYIKILDTTEITSFYMNDTVFLYLLKSGVLLLKEPVYDTVSDSVKDDAFFVHSNTVYFVKNRSVTAYIPGQGIVAEKEFTDENPCFINLWKSNVMLTTRDTSQRYIYIHELDSMLTEKLYFTISVQGAYLTPFQPIVFNGYMYLPYVLQASGEYRVIRFNLEDNTQDGVFTGYGTVSSMVALEGDSILISELPYGKRDFRLVFVDFSGGQYSVSNYIGTGMGILKHENNLLFIQTDGRLDIYDMNLTHVVNDFPVKLMSNILSGGKIELYSLYQIPQNAYYEIYDMSGRRILYGRLNIPVGISKLPVEWKKSGMYVLKLYIRSNIPFSYKVIYLNNG